MIFIPRLASYWSPVQHEQLFCSNAHIVEARNVHAMKHSDYFHRIDIVLMSCLLVEQALYHFSWRFFWFDSKFQIQPHKSNTASHQSTYHRNWDDEVHLRLWQEAGQRQIVWPDCDHLHSGLAWECLVSGNYCVWRLLLSYRRWIIKCSSTKHICRGTNNPVGMDRSSFVYGCGGA